MTRQLGSRGTWTDKTVMPWGKHKGTLMAEVPASYLDWLRDQPWLPDWPGLHSYIKANKARIDKELEDDQPDPRPDDGFESFEDYKRYG